MKLFYLLNSFIGQYVLQSLLHAFIAVVIVDFAIYIWKIENPALRQKLRFIVVTFPVVSFPIYQLINPERGSLYFRLDEALFDINRWLTMTLWGKIPLSVFLLIIIFFTIIIFMIQEFIPIIRHFLEPDEEEVMQSHDVQYQERINRVLDGLPVDNVDISIIDDNDHLIYSTTGKVSVIYITTGLIDDLSDDELKVALAHEVAHILRNRKPLLIIVFFLRIIMFYNPITLIEFRRIVEDEEKICDDMAISWTHRPEVLIDTLNKFYIKEERLRDNKKRGFASIEEYSHNMLIKSRIERMVMGNDDGSKWFWLKFSAVLTSIVIINYYVV